jgi:hypothetical protein
LGSIQQAPDSLGLDIEQAIMSCFDGFTMDISRAKVCGDHMVIIFFRQAAGGIPFITEGKEKKYT